MSTSAMARVYVAFDPKREIPQGAWIDLVVELVFHTPLKYDGNEISLASIPYGGGLSTFSRMRLSNIPFAIVVVDPHADSPFDAMMASDNDCINDLRVDGDSDDIRVLLLCDDGDCDTDDEMVVASMSVGMLVSS